jgi:DNA-binding Lrp family transcriptional regulator
VAAEAERLAKGFAPLIELLKILSRVVREVAEFEESEGERLDQALNEMLAPERMIELSAKLPPEVFGTFIAATMKFAAVAGKLQGFWQLPPSEKRKLAEEVEQIAASWERFIRELEEAGKIKGCEASSDTPDTGLEPKMLGASLEVSGVLDVAVNALREYAKTLSSILSAERERGFEASSPKRAMDAALAAVLAASAFLSAPAEKLKARIEQECEELTGSPCKVGARYDPDWGCVYEVAVGASARKALEANLKLQEKFPGIPIVVEWAGEKDVTDEELVDYLVKTAIKGGFRVEAPPGFDAVKAREG